MKIFFNLDGRRDKHGETAIRLSITLPNGTRIQTLTGFKVYPESWDKKRQKVKSGTCNSRYDEGERINDDLIACLSRANKIKKEYERNHDLRNLNKNEIQELKTLLLTKAFTVSKRRIKKDSTPAVKPDKDLTLIDVLHLFTKECGRERCWTEDTYEKFRTVEKHLLDFKKNLSFQNFNRSGLVDYQHHLLNKCGLVNTSVLKQIGFLKWFLKWADENGYNPVQDYKTFRPKLKTPIGLTDIVYLTFEELTTLLNYEFNEQQEHLARVRDVFCFCSFTSLRYSDAKNLKRTDIHDDSLYVITQKTSDGLKIPLNNFSRQILKRYEDDPFQKEYALPVVSNQKMNEHLKEIGKLCEFNRMIKCVTYVGNKCNTEYKPLYEKLTTHVARKTFICNALILEMPPTTVMKYTGHSDYKSMKPYVDVVDAELVNSMQVFNKLASVAPSKTGTL